MTSSLVDITRTERASEDELYVQRDNDVILGDNGELNFSPKTWTDDPRDVALDSIQTTDLVRGGPDIISGNAGDDYSHWWYGRRYPLRRRCGCFLPGVQMVKTF